MNRLFISDFGRQPPASPSYRLCEPEAIGVIGAYAPEGFCPASPSYRLCEPEAIGVIGAYAPEGFWIGRKRQKITRHGVPNLYWNLRFICYLMLEIWDFFVL